MLFNLLMSIRIFNCESLPPSGIYGRGLLSINRLQEATEAFNFYHRRNIDEQASTETSSDSSSTTETEIHKSFLHLSSPIKHRLLPIKPTFSMQRFHELFNYILQEYTITKLNNRIQQSNIDKTSTTKLLSNCMKTFLKQFALQSKELSNTLSESQLETQEMVTSNHDLSKQVVAAKTKSKQKTIELAHFQQKQLVLQEIEEKRSKELSEQEDTVQTAIQSFRTDILQLRQQEMNTIQTNRTVKQQQLQDQWNQNTTKTNETTDRLETQAHLFLANKTYDRIEKRHQDMTTANKQLIVRITELEHLQEIKTKELEIESIDLLKMQNETNLLLKEEEDIQNELHCQKNGLEFLPLVHRTRKYTRLQIQQLQLHVKKMKQQIESKNGKASLIENNIQKHNLSIDDTTKRLEKLDRTFNRFMQSKDQVRLDIRNIEKKYAKYSNKEQELEQYELPTIECMKTMIDNQLQVLESDITAIKNKQSDKYLQHPVMIEIASRKKHTLLLGDMLQEKRNLLKIEIEKGHKTIKENKNQWKVKEMEFNQKTLDLTKDMERNIATMRERKDKLHLETTATMEVFSTLRKIQLELKFENKNTLTINNEIQHLQEQKNTCIAKIETNKTKLLQHTKNMQEQKITNETMETKLKEVLTNIATTKDEIQIKNKNINSLIESIQQMNEIETIELTKQQEISKQKMEQSLAEKKKNEARIEAQSASFNKMNIIKENGRMKAKIKKAKGDIEKFQKIEIELNELKESMDMKGDTSLEWQRKLNETEQELMGANTELEELKVVYNNEWKKLENKKEDEVFNTWKKTTDRMQMTLEKQEKLLDDYEGEEIVFDQIKTSLQEMEKNLIEMNGAEVDVDVEDDEDIPVKVKGEENMEGKEDLSIGLVDKLRNEVKIVSPKRQLTKTTIELKQ